MEKLLEVFGFGEKPARWWAWSIVIVTVVIFVTIFFLSYSLARHKRMVARLTATVTEQQAQIKVRDIQLKKKDDELKLALLKKDDKIDKEKRDKIRKHLKQIEQDEKKARDDLKKKRKDLQDDSIDDLIKKAKRLTKETL